MSFDGLRQIRSMASQYRLPLLTATCVVVFASLLSQHVNSSDEASRALHKVYGGTAHFELCHKEAAHPTR
jgi:hypothetical protein